METAEGLRAEASRLRAILSRVTDDAELVAIEAMLEELERRAKATDNHDALIIPSRFNYTITASETGTN